MNAPVVILAVEAPEASVPAPAVPALTPAALGLELFEAAMRGEVALSDHTGCWYLLGQAYGHPSFELVAGARRVAIDLAQHASRQPDAALARACRAALAAARDALADPGEDAELPDAHAALADIAEELGAALALISDGGH